MHWRWLKSDQTCTQANKICWRCSLWPRPETGVGGTTVAPWVAQNVNKFLCKTAQEGGSGLAIHTSGFDWNWLKVVIVEKVMIVFLAFVCLSISCYYTAWCSSTDYVVTFFLVYSKNRHEYKQSTVTASNT